MHWAESKVTVVLQSVTGSLLISHCVFGKNKLWNVFKLLITETYLYEDKHKLPACYGSFCLCSSSIAVSEGATLHSDVA